MTDLWRRFVQLSQATKTFYIRNITLKNDDICDMQNMPSSRVFCFFFKEVWLKEMLHF